MQGARGDMAGFRGVVTGRVQGVNFRSFVLRQAAAMDLTGYVRNLPGGRAVEVRAEGPRDRLERLIELLHEGPRMAVVEDVEQGKEILKRHEQRMAMEASSATE